jgi:glyoxylase-like metal-dependent hydrolase (beta-lactamase superfamily II)
LNLKSLRGLAAKRQKFQIHCEYRARRGVGITARRPLKTAFRVGKLNIWEITMTQLTRRSMLGGAVAASTIAPLILRSAAQAAAPAAGKQMPGVYRSKIGEFEITSFNDGFTKVPKLENYVVNAPLEEIQKALEAGFIPKDDLRIPFNPLLVNTGKNLVLFDTGFGDNGSPTHGALLANLAAAGIDPKSIDTVIISHFHPDHISGLRTKAGMANFPNAEIMMPAGEWAYWTDAGESSRAPAMWNPAFANVKRVFDPIAKDVKQFEFGKELVPRHLLGRCARAQPGPCGFRHCLRQREADAHRGRHQSSGSLRTQSGMAAVGGHDPGPGAGDAAQAARHGGGRSLSDHRLSLSVPGGRLYRQAQQWVRFRTGRLAVGALS